MIIGEVHHITAVSLGWDLATLNRRHFAGIRGLRLTQHGA